MTRQGYDWETAFVESYMPESQSAADLPPAATARGVTLARMSAEHKEHLIRVLPRESRLRQALLRNRWQGR